MRRTAAVLALAILTWLPGCGSGSGSTGGTADLGFEVHPAELTLAPGEEETLAVTIERSAEAAGPVSLRLAPDSVGVDRALSGPTGIEGSFAPDPAPGDTSVLTLSLEASVPEGTYDLAVQGTTGSVSAEAPLTLTVAEEAP
ncbi:MAG: hypothetical protein GVY27_12145, partial [Deinococcus-Thermus bacterium]|nr:hypothetical protein [Deinococcota bacterium]